MLIILPCRCVFWGCANADVPVIKTCKWGYFGFLVRTPPGIMIGSLRTIPDKNLKDLIRQIVISYVLIMIRVKM